MARTDVGTHRYDRLSNLGFPGWSDSKEKTLSAMWETHIGSLNWEDPLEKGMANHSSTLAWRIPWTEEPGWLQSMGSCTEWDTTEQLSLSGSDNAESMGFCSSEYSPNKVIIIYICKKYIKKIKSISFISLRE